MSNGDLSDQYIDDTFDGLLHVAGQPIPSTGLVKVFDGLGNESSLSVGRSGNGVSVSGTITTTSLNASSNITTGFLKAGNVNYPTSPVDISLLNLIYPVGAVYFSAFSTSPALLFGGAWDRIADGMFIVGQGTGTDRNDLSQYFGPGKSTSGEYKHTLTTGQLPSHSHTGYGVSITSETTTGGSQVSNPWDTLKNKSVLVHDSGGHGIGTATSEVNGTLDTELIIDETGSDQSHNNTPPGFGLYVYTRTA